MSSRFVEAAKEERLSLEIENYHLPGVGTLEVRLLPYTEHIINFLDHYGHIKKLHETNQLGSLRQLYQGAHHTRYEYVFLQWAIADSLSEKPENLSNQIGLSCEQTKLPKINQLSKHASGREVLQSLSLLTNIGHFKETFAGSRTLLCLLKRDVNFRSSFRKGLDTSVRKMFDECLNSMNEYKIHLFVALFLLERDKRPRQYGECVAFCRDLLARFLRGEEESQSLSSIFRLFDAIRKTAYLLIDSHMSSTPFKVDSSSVFGSSLAYRIYEEEDPVLNNALNDMERILQNYVYMNASALLASQQCTERQLKKLDGLCFSKGIKSVHDLIGSQSKSDVFNSLENLDYNHTWDKKKVAEIEFKSLPYKFVDGILGNDLYEISRSLQERIGRKYCLVGCQTSADNELFKIAYGISEKIAPDLCFEVRKRTVAESLKIELSIRERDNESKTHENNANRLLTFLLNGLFVDNLRVVLDYRKVAGRENPFIVSRGVNSAKKQIDEYTESVEKMKLLTEDEVFEVKKTTEVIKDIGCKGLTLTYIGSTKILKERETFAEFDGIIVYPTSKDVSIVIVEVKNKHNGTYQSEIRLRNTLEKQLLRSIFAYKINTIQRAAYATISIAQE